LDRVTLAYGCAHFGKISFWYASEVLFAYYLSEVCGLSPARMGVVLALSFILGAAADLLVSELLRDYLQRIDNAVRLQLVGAMTSAAALSGLFMGTYVPADARLAFALLFAGAFRLSYVLFDLPQNVLLSIATSDEHSRARLASLRIFFSSVGSMLVAVSVAPLMSDTIALPHSTRFMLLASALSLLAIAGALALTRAARGWQRSAPAALPTRSAPVGTGGGFPAHMWLNIFMSFSITLLVSCFGKVAPFYAAYSLSGIAWSVYVLPGAALGSAVSQPAWTWLALRAGRSGTLAAGATMLSAAALVFLLFGGVPPAAIVAAFFIGASSSGMGMTLWAAFAGMVSRHAGMSASKAYGWLTAALKVALACGGLGIGAVLTRIDYRSAHDSGLLELMSLPVMAAGVVILLSVAIGRTQRFRHDGAPY
jgi:Na+/melibiose symporter-like transporter